jgi:hypothetical protein
VSNTNDPVGELVEGVAVLKVGLKLPCACKTVGEKIVVKPVLPVTPIAGLPGAIVKSILEKPRSSRPPLKETAFAGAAITLIARVLAAISWSCS